MTPAPAMDRRDVLKLGGAAALALLAPDAVAVAARASSLTPSTIVVADPRYRESLIFAGSLERHGAKVVTLASDRAANLVRRHRAATPPRPAPTDRAHP